MTETEVLELILSRLHTQEERLGSIEVRLRSIERNQGTVLEMLHSICGGNPSGAQAPSIDGA